MCNSDQSEQSRPIITGGTIWPIRADEALGKAEFRWTRDDAAMSTLLWEFGCMHIYCRRLQD